MVFIFNCAFVKMPKKSDFGLLHRLNYPPYQLRAVTNDELIVCGGGGGSKTGIPNTIEVLRLDPPPPSMPASALPTVRVAGSVDTDVDAVMALDVTTSGSYFNIVAARTATCFEYGVRKKAEANGVVGDGGGVTQRGAVPGKPADAANGGLLTGESCEFSIHPVQQVVVSAEKGVTVNVVRMSRCGRRFATGSSDGYLRVFDAQSFQLLLETQAHGPEPKYEVNCVDASPSWSRICTVGGSDKFARLWRSEDLSKVTELTLPCNTTVPYKFRHCVFGRLEGKENTKSVETSDSWVLYTSHTPVRPSSKSPAPSYIVSWESTKYRPKHTVNVGPELISCLAVSDQGRYVAMATIEGSVSVYISFSMQRLYRLKQAHNVFVTCVEFLPSSRALRNQQDFELLSASADSLIRLHRLPVRASYSCWIPVVAAALLIWGLFYMLVELKL